MDQVNISTYIDRIHDIECPKLGEVPTLESIEASPRRFLRDDVQEQRRVHAGVCIRPGQ